MGPQRIDVHVERTRERAGGLEPRRTTSLQAPNHVAVDPCGGGELGLTQTAHDPHHSQRMCGDSDWHDHLAKLDVATVWSAFTA